MAVTPAADATPAADRLESARRRIESLDADLVRLAAERVAAAREAGRAKAELGQPTVDFARERAVLERARQAAADAGLDAGVAEDLLMRLIVASTTRQETDRVAAAGLGAGKTAVVVGGAGRLGGWLTAFLRSTGHDTFVLDPAAPAQLDAARRQLRSAGLVLVAVAPSEAARLYDAWAADPPRGVVADVCSVKAPLLGALRRLAAAGVHVASFHPMFGPSAAVLRDCDVVLCRTGDAVAEQAVRDLFTPTSARLVEVGLEEHDRLMADVLSLAHAAAIAVATSLPGAPVAQSTTYRRLRDVAASVVRESPQVYYEVQAGNPHSLDAIDRLAANLARLRASIAAKDADSFAALLAEGRQRIEGTP